MAKLRVESVAEKPEFRFGIFARGHRKDVESILDIVKAVHREVSLGGANDALLFAISDGILGRLGVLSGFHLDKHQDIPIPGNDVHFPALGSIAGRHDLESKRAEVINGIDLGAAAKSQEAFEEERKRHSLRDGGNRIRQRGCGKRSLLFLDHQRRR